MKPMFTAMRPSAAKNAQDGKAVISLQASPRSTSRRKSQRNAMVAAVPRANRSSRRRQTRIVSKYCRMAFPSGARPFSRRREVALGLGIYAVYLLVRQAVVNERGRAEAARNAQRIVALERRLGLHVEPRLQALLLPRRRLVASLNVAYVTLNVGLTGGWLMRLFRRGHPEFHRLRRAAALTTLGAH